MPSAKQDTFLWQSLLIVFATFLAAVVADQLGSAEVIMIVIWAPALYYVMFRLPPHQTARVFLLLGLVLESPDERPGNGYWTPPFVPASGILYESLRKWTGIPGLSFSLFPVLCLILYLRARKVKPPPGEAKPPPESLKALRYYALGFLGFLAWGIVRGGQIQPAYWQLLVPMTTGLCALAFLYATRTTDIRAFGTIIVVAAVTKALQVVWVYEVVCRPLNIKPFHATTHSDSVTFASAIIIAASMAFEDRSKANIRRLLWVVPFMMAAVVMNNRRLAFVGVVGGVVTAYALMRSGPAKKKLTRGLLIASPFIFAYIKIGSKIDNPLFMPAQLLASVTEQKDASSITRDIENYNLIVTLKSSRIFGTGFGHEYIEAVVADDITHGASAHLLYRYIPHNSILGMWAAVGPAGMAIIWIPYLTLAFFAARSYRLSKKPLERAACLSALGMTTSVLAQHWGDMGLHSYPATLAFSASYAIVAKLGPKLEDADKNRSVSVTPGSLPVTS
jgi:hypothetical protein